MKLKNFELDKSDDDINVLVNCSVIIDNTSSFVAKRAKSEFKIETSDGFITSGATYVEEIEVNPGDNHELNPYARSVFGAFGTSRSAKVSVNAQLYKISKEINAELAIPEKNGVVEKLSDSFSIENNDFNVKGMVWAFPNGKATDIGYTLQLESKFPINDVDLNLQVELIDHAGNSIDSGSPSLNRVLGQSPFFDSGFYGVKKKDLKGLKIKFNLSLFSSIDECSSTLIEVIEI